MQGIFEFSRLLVFVASVTISLGITALTALADQESSAGFANDYIEILPADLVLAPDGNTIVLTSEIENLLDEELYIRLSDETDFEATDEFGNSLVLKEEPAGLPVNSHYTLCQTPQYGVLLSPGVATPVVFRLSVEQDSIIGSHFMFIGRIESCINGGQRFMAVGFSADID